MRLMPSSVARREPFDCERWTASPPTADAAERIGIHDVYTLPLVGAQDADTLVARAVEVLMRYDVFPAHRMRHHVCTRGGILRTDALVIQRLFAGPLAVEAAVRVDEVFDERARGGPAGFTYTTLQGHVERGTATFSVGLDGRGVPVLKIESWSRPGNALATMGRPLIRRIQRSSVQEALRHVQSLVAGSPVGSSSQ
jgi:uncharacterized protein (UPF0548 family)